MAVASLRVHRIAFSTNVERVALALAHKQVAVTWVEVDPADRRPLIALSGQELVPVLETPDAVVIDSTVILRWLEQQVPDPPLWPADPQARAVTNIAIAWFNEVWKRAPNAIDEELSRPHPDADAIAGWSREIQDTLPWFETLLDGRDFLLGDTLGAMDVVSFPVPQVPHDRARRRRHRAVPLDPARAPAGGRAASPGWRRGSRGSTPCPGPER